MSHETKTLRGSRRLSRLQGRIQRTGPSGSRPDPVRVAGLVAIAERARALDHSLAQALRPVTLPVLRVLLGLVFVWFGALKVIGRSPVAGLIAHTLPFGNDQLVVLLLGTAELALGGLLISGVFVRLALLGLAMHLAGTFSTFAMAPGLMFSDGNPLLLTADGEFVTKNGVLIAATLVLITHTSRTAANSSGRMPERLTEALESPGFPADDPISRQLQVPPQPVVPQF